MHAQGNFTKNPNFPPISVLREQGQFAPQVDYENILRLAEEPDNLINNIFKPDFAAYSQRIAMQASKSQYNKSGVV